MKITKYHHSCLVVEDQGKVVLVDPGNYSYDSHSLEISKLKQLDAIVITHEHMDHMYIPWIKEILVKFPNTPIYTTSSAKKLLEQDGIKNTHTEGNDFIQLENVPHEALWFGNPGENVMATLFGRLATPGDSLTFSLNQPHPNPLLTGEGNQENENLILALPVTAPWGSTTRAVEVAIKLNPKVIIPIHDWHWKDQARLGMYQWIKGFFAQNGIEFKVVESGETIEV